MHVAKTGRNENNKMIVDWEGKKMAMISACYVVASCLVIQLSDYYPWNATVELLIINKITNNFNISIYKYN